MNWIDSFQISVNGLLSHVAEAASVVHQGSVICPISFAIYANDLAHNLTIDNLLYTDDDKLIALEGNRLQPPSPFSKAPWALVPNGPRVTFQPCQKPSRWRYPRSCYIRINN